MSFAEILEAVSDLPLYERIELSEIIQKQLIEEKRSILASEILISNEELQNGSLKVQTIDEIMDDILNEI